MDAYTASISATAVKARLDVFAVRRLARAALERSQGMQGRADPELSAELQALEADAEFSPRSAAEFQHLLAQLGVASSLPIGLPLDREPYWFRAGHPLANYQSTPDLPATADVVIIGAGLTGAACAYHLSEAARSPACRSWCWIAGTPRAKPAAATEELRADT